MRLFILFIGLFIFSQCSDPCDGLDCGPNGVCIEGDCECNTGYSGPNCNISDNCEDVNEAMRMQDLLVSF